MHAACQQIKKIYKKNKDEHRKRQKKTFEKKDGWMNEYVNK